MDNSLFFIFEKVVKWGSGSFEFYLLFFMNAIWSGAIQGMLLSNIRWKGLRDALRGLIETKHFKKTSFPNRWSGIFLVESIEGWSNKQDNTSKQTSDHKTKINPERTIGAKLTWVTGGTTRRAWRLIRLRNPTEDKRAFRRMLTSADLLKIVPAARTYGLYLCS